MIWAALGALYSGGRVHGNDLKVNAVFIKRSHSGKAAGNS
jgi:hypothetical protein